MTVRDLLRRNEDFAALDEATVGELESKSILKKYGKGDVLFAEREESRCLFFLVKGHTAIYKINKNHDRKVIFMCSGGDFLNEEVLQSPMASASCMAMGEVTVMKTPLENVRYLMEKDRALETCISMSAMKKLRRCYRQLGNSMNTVLLEHQVASKIWKFAKDYGKSDKGMVKIPFDLSITFMADIMGSKRETVSRTVKKLSEKDLIKFSGNTLYVVDMERLRSYAAGRE